MSDAAETKKTDFFTYKGYPLVRKGASISKNKIRNKAL